MERTELELEKLINCIAQEINNGKLDGDKIPDLDICTQELRVLVETYVAVMIKKDKRF